MIEIIKAGLHTTIQGFAKPTENDELSIIFDAGAMDSLALRIANKLVGNSEGALALEITCMGPVLKFHSDALIALSGADFDVHISGQKIELNSPVHVRKGELLEIKNSGHHGLRVYMAIKGGFELCPKKQPKTHNLNLKYGGSIGKTLNAGDKLKLLSEEKKVTVSKHLQNIHGNTWTFSVIPGPHCMSDYFSTRDIGVFYSSKWEVHHQSNRFGIQLIGPEVKFAKEFGIEEGLHPSSMIDYPLSVGSVVLCGNTPYIIGNDGPVLGGYLSIATIISADLWKIGQLRPRDKMKFKKVSLNKALDINLRQEKLLATI